MGSALSAAVSGLKAHQTMLDVAGNNLANVNTTGYKSSTVTFAELLSQTIRGATGPTSNLGGTNPLQTGSGVEVAGITRNQTQGSIVSTGQDLDVAIDGSALLRLTPTIRWLIRLRATRYFNWIIQVLRSPGGRQCRPARRQRL